MLFRSPLGYTFLAAAVALACTSSSGRARAGGDIYEVTKQSETTKVGASGKATVTITGKNGWHVNEQAPLWLKVTPGPGISVEKEKLTRADLSENTATRARFEVLFTAAEAGPKTIAAEASFVMCQETACKPVKEKIALAIAVKK